MLFRVFFFFFLTLRFFFSFSLFLHFRRFFPSLFLHLCTSLSAFFFRLCVGYTYRSETDTEVIAHLVGLELDSDPSMHLKVALAKTVAKLDGTWGLAVIAHEK